MNTRTQQDLEARGYTVGDAAALLNLTPEEEALVETGLVLSNLLRQTRRARGLSQKHLAEKLGLKQPDIARLEVAAGTNFDALFGALYALQVSPHEIAAALETVTLKTAESHQQLAAA